MPTFKSYFIGFIVSIAITFAAYLAVADHIEHVVAVISFLALAEFLVQLVFFIHLDTGPSAKWNWLFFGFTALTALIIVGGSLWIMNNLNYNMTPAQMNAAMLDQAE